MSDDKKREPLRISVEEAKKRVDNDGVAILDVDDPGAYDNRSDRIEDAVRIDPREIEEEFERLPQERTVLTYCT